MGIGDQTQGKSLLLTLTEPSRMDWRFKDRFGLSEKTLDCRQLAVNEVLKWKGETEPLRVFLNAFDCTHSGLKLRRSAPELGAGWQLDMQQELDAERIRRKIIETFCREGYCLIYYQAYHASFLKYWHAHDVEHWSLVIGCDEGGITLADEAGAPDFFRGHIGFVPWAVIFDSWQLMSAGGIATVTGGSDRGDWDIEFLSLVRQSVNHMRGGGLACLHSFVQAVSGAPLDELIPSLEQLEFDIHYFRKLRELWQLAVQQSVVPGRFMQPEWVEELFYVCKCWSLIMGVVMKWKRQPERDYRLKLVDYLHQTWRNEQRLFESMASLPGL
ncbi:hypothetical protein DNH61_06350 [Paenibacillus sambharensis]|uniref:Butirosin biosynthesis protein H N-terminal domain-containing protein n=1 Tax=Paenibacillus sambharensis TaxID=1803190 RepID=A0A2W1LPN1_9BACL|nr:hypothetical protein [Paenibacillus sambharensis]PZD96815.1 hypothetical protein DNH61_06350 [Paenibacillus sambharensis]